MECNVTDAKFNANWNRWCYFCNQAALRKFLSASLLEGHCRRGPGPFAAYGCAHGPNTCQIWHKLGPDFAECRSLKPLDWFSPFTVLWTCLDFLLCTVIVICLFAPNGLAYGPKLVKWGSTWDKLCRSHIWNRWMDLYQWNSHAYGNGATLLSFDLNHEFSRSNL